MALEAPAKNTDRHFSDIEVGEYYTDEQARTVTETDIINFAGVSGDFHPLHVSDPFGEKAGYGEKIAHGNLVFAIAETIAGELNQHAISYGHDNLRYVRPVTIGDTLSARREVLEKTDYDDEMGRILYEYEATNQRDETVMIDNHIMLVRKRKAE